MKTFKEIYAFLSSNSDYLSDEQTIAILVKIVDALRDDLSLSEAEISGIVNFIFDMYMEKDNEAKKTIALGIFNILNANGATIFRREIMEQCIIHRATGIIIAHNHPSGVCLPSNEDLELTHRIKAAADATDIRFIDHILVTPTSWRSLRTKKLI